MIFLPSVQTNALAPRLTALRPPHRAEQVRVRRRTGQSQTLLRQSVLVAAGDQAVLLVGLVVSQGVLAGGHRAGSPAESLRQPLVVEGQLRAGTGFGAAGTVVRGGVEGEVGEVGEVGVGEGFGGGAVAEVGDLVLVADEFEGASVGVVGQTHFMRKIIRIIAPLRSDQPIQVHLTSLIDAHPYF